jgi:hypothetical protein
MSPLNPLLSFLLIEDMRISANYSLMMLQNFNLTLNKSVKNAHNLLLTQKIKPNLSMLPPRCLHMIYTTQYSLF